MKTINGIFKLMLGTAAIILSIAALAYSSKSAHAEPAENNKSLMLPQPTQTVGKYQIQYVCGLDGNDKFYWHMCIGNTETGKFDVYRWSKDEQGWKNQFKTQFPSLP